MEKKGIIWRSIAITIGVIIIIALCFFVWKSPEVYSQGMAIVVSAALGAILTAIITRMVIGSQLQSEQEKEKNIKIYEMKLEVFSKFISDMWKLFDDDKLDDTEMRTLRSNVFNKLIFLLKKDDIEILTKYIADLQEKVENESQPHVIAEILGNITRLLRKDLSLSRMDDQGAVALLWGAFTKDIETENAIPQEHLSNEQFSSISINTERQYWHMNMVDRSVQQNALKNGINELSLIEWDTDKRTNALKEVNKGDLIFLYNKGNMFLGIFEAIGRRIFYYDGEALKEEYIEKLGSPARIIEDSAIIKEDVKKYDIYGGIEDSADYCSNLIVKPLACMLMPKDEDVAAYRPTICRYWKDYGDSILNKYKEALETNNEEFGKIDGEAINCDTETFKSLFK